MAVPGTMTSAFMAREKADAHSTECVLRFLMVNGESFRMSFPFTSSVEEVKQGVINRKPSELLEFLQSSSPSSPAPSRVDEIRILHLGKFLDDAKTLKDYGFSDAPNDVTTVHISCRVQANVLEEVKGKLDKKGGACCVTM